MLHLNGATTTSNGIGRIVECILDEIDVGGSELLIGHV